MASYSLHQCVAIVATMLQRDELPPIYRNMGGERGQVSMFITVILSRLFSKNLSTRSELKPALEFKLLRKGVH